MRAVLRPKACRIAPLVLLGLSCDSAPTDDDAATTTAAAEVVCEASVPACTLEHDAPNYEQLFTEVFAVSCGVGGTDCHARDDAHGAKSGELVFTDIELAYTRLLQSDRSYIVPECPAESLVVERMLSDDPERKMPREGELSPDQVCDVINWVRHGALR